MDGDLQLLPRRQIATNVPEENSESQEHKILIVQKKIGEERGREWESRKRKSVRSGVTAKYDG